MDKQVKKRRGGPRTFDREKAIDTAMRLFWRHGFEGVSLNDLTAAIGIAPPSLYAAFGSKAGLYREALDRYSGLPRKLSNFGPATSLPEAVEELLHRSVCAATDPDGERGCMISSGMIQCGEDHLPLARELAERRMFMRDTIATRLEQWLDPAEAASLAQYLITVLFGISVQARDGASREELQQIARAAMAAVSAKASSN